jgi:hypothetical protein
MTDILTSMWARLWGNVPRPTVSGALSRPLLALTARRRDGAF